MITPTQMYWLTRLDNICDILGAGGLITLLLGVSFLLVYWINDGDEYFKICKPLGIKTLVLFLALLVGSAFVPNTKQMAAIIVVPKIINNEKVQTVGNKVYDLAIEWMDTLKPAKAKGESK